MTSMVGAGWSAPCSRATIACVCALMLGCGSGSPDHDPAPEPSAEAANGIEAGSSIEVVRGYAVHGHEVRTLRPCGAEEALWAIDDSAALWVLHKELAPHVKAYEELFVVVEGRRSPAPGGGFGSDYPEVLHVERVLYAGLEGPACDADWDRFEFRALGNEPSWSAVVTAEGIRFSRMGEADLEWTTVSKEPSGDGIRYAGDGTSTQGPIELLVTGDPCRDTMSGAYSGFSATLHLDDEELRGCALKGARSAG